jgi:hypothetical protein
MEKQKKPHHLPHRVAQEALRLQRVRSICCGALQLKEITFMKVLKP